MMKNDLKFRKNETFYIRDGWFEKAINTINEVDVNVFSKNNGINLLGIGSNMVKGLKYWLTAADIVDAKNGNLTDFGNLILKYDQYCEQKFTWFLIHYKLVTNKSLCPIFNAFYNMPMKNFTKSLFNDYIYNYFLSNGYDVNKSYVDADIAIFLKSYFNDNILENPEDNYVCPLSSLKLIKKTNDEIKKIKPVYSSLSYLVIYYTLQEKYKSNPFKVEDSFEDENSPYSIFNLDKNMYLQYLDEMRNKGLITINKTAGLNTIYFEHILTLEKIFEMNKEDK